MYELICILFKIAKQMFHAALLLIYLPLNLIYFDGGIDTFHVAFYLFFRARNRSWIHICPVTYSPLINR